MVPFAVALSVSWALDADVAAALAGIDAVVAANGAERVTGAGAAYCGEGDAASQSIFVRNRAFLCDASRPVEAWLLRDAADHGRFGHVATLGVRRFTSAAAAKGARDIALARYGGGTVGIFDGATGWCFADAVWSGDLLWTLTYGCGVSLSRFPGLAAVRAHLLAAGAPTAEGAVAVIGSHSGWSFLLGPTGKEVTVPPERRWRVHAHVTDVAANDVLWMRARPPEGPKKTLAEKVGSLRADRRCVPVIYSADPSGWWKVSTGAAEGWVNARYLALEEEGRCVGR